MTLQHIARHWLIACFGILLGVLSMNATAIDPGTVTGKLTHNGKAYSLRHVYAWQPPGQTKEMWVYLTDSELPAATAQGAFTLKELAKGNRFRGVKLVVNPAKPNLKESHFDLFVSEEDVGEIRVSSFQFWQRLSVGDKRVTGRLKFDVGEWSLDAQFNAPVFGPSVNVQTLTGAQAQRSPQADVFLAFEKALNWKGVEAAGAYTTPERLAEMNDQLKQIGAETFKTMQAARQKGTAQGEARRKQIEKVVIDGDSAVLEARASPISVSLVRLTKFNGNWKVAK